MLWRSKLLMAAAALLYLGPLLSGLAGYGWANVPVFAGVFLLWLVILRPQIFPRTADDWSTPRAWLTFAAQLAVQVLLVSLCFGIGRGIGGVLGVQPAIPALLPVAMSFLAVVAGRLIWNPHKMAGVERLLDEALSQIEAAVPAAQNRDYVAAMLAPLNGLPADVTDATLGEHLAALRHQLDEDLMIEVLLQQARFDRAAGHSKRLLMLLSSDGVALDRMTSPDIPMQALTVLRGDADLVSVLAGRLVEALQQDDDLWQDCPTTDFLARLAADLPAAAPALMALSRAVAKADPANNR